jgi:RHS repeat-associated protein
VTRTWTLDPAGRLASMGTTGAGSTALANHYPDTGSDSPDWTLDTNTGGTATTRRYLDGLTGGLTIEAATTGASTTLTPQLVGLHGDVLRTTSLTATGSPDGPSIDTDEYGVVRDTTGAPTTGPRHAWLGGHQRPTDTGTLGLILMGVRLYTPLLGRFLQTDPIYGGNPNTYTYPTDPINVYDLDGRSWVKRMVGWLGNNIGTIGTVASTTALVLAMVGTGGALVPVLAGIGMGASMISAAVNLSRGKPGAAAWDAVGLVAGARAWKLARRAKDLRWLANKQRRSGNPQVHALWRSSRQQARNASVAARRWANIDKGLTAAGASHVGCRAIRLCR